MSRATQPKPTIRKGENMTIGDLSHVAVKPLRVGDNLRIMGVESTLAQTKTTADGMRYELFNGAALREQRAALRIIDADTGFVIGVKQFPNYDMAEVEYLKGAA